jgi:hypothetical protein
MQLSLTDRVRWSWLLVMVACVVSAAVWWQPAPEQRVVLAQRPATTVANPAPAADINIPPAPAPIPVAPPAPALKLVGTVGTGGSSFAMVRHAEDPQLLQLRVGDHIDGLAVTAIEPDRVVLAGAAQPVVIEAEKPAAAADSPAPSGAAILPAGSKPKQQPQEWPEGQAPWDLVPPFQH